MFRSPGWTGVLTSGPSRFGLLREQESSNQEPGDHEEDINACKPPSQPRQAGMEGDDGGYGQCAQAIDVGAILQHLSIVLAVIATCIVARIIVPALNGGKARTATTRAVVAS